MHNTRATKATACTPNHNQSRARAIHMAKERRKMGIDERIQKLESYKDRHCCRSKIDLLLHSFHTSLEEQ
jgi:hypothetical protein